MRLSFLFVIFIHIFSCGTTPTADSTLDGQEKTDIEYTENRKSKNNQATFSVYEIRDPKAPPGLPGLQTAAVQEKIRAPFSVYKEGVYTVISPDGSRMLSEPSLSADVVGAVPYLDQVEMVDIHNVVKDTLNKDIKYKGYSHSNFDKNISGDWVKVNYDGKEAYVFSAYLVYGKPRWNRPSWKNKNYAINSISRDCILEVHENPAMNWYGVFNKEGGFFMQPIDIGYRILHEKNMLSNCIVNANPSKGLGLCFGTMKEMNTQYLDIKEANVKLEYDSLYYPQSAKLKNASKVRLAAMNLDIQKIKGKDGFELILSNGKMSQVLEKGLGLEACWPADIYLVGDIDQDGKVDYYINYVSHDNIGDAVLYLSSEAKEGEMVRPVAMNEKGYCC